MKEKDAVEALRAQLLRSPLSTIPAAATSAPILNPPVTATGPVGTSLTLSGASLGSQPGSQLMMNGSPIPVTSFSDTAVKFTVPVDDPATGLAWAGLPKVVPLVVTVMGQTSNSVNFTVTP